MERRDEFGRPFGDGVEDRNRFYDGPNEDSSLAWIGGLFAFMVVIGGLFYAFSGPSGEHVATNTTPPMTRSAPAPTVTPAPAITPAPVPAPAPAPAQ